MYECIVYDIGTAYIINCFASKALSKKVLSNSVLKLEMYLCLAQNIGAKSLRLFSKTTAFLHVFSAKGSYKIDHCRPIIAYVYVCITRSFLNSVNNAWKYFVLSKCVKNKNCQKSWTWRWLFYVLSLPYFAIQNKVYAFFKADENVNSVPFVPR